MSTKSNDIDLTNVVIFENLVVNKDNFDHKIKGLSDFITVMRLSKEPLACQDIQDYFQQIKPDLIDKLPVKEQQKFQIIKNSYDSYKHNNHTLASLYPQNTVISNLVAMINVSWSSVISLRIPGIQDAFPILLNYSMRVPDCYPYLPMGGINQLFESLSVSSSIAAYLDYLEMADYDSSALPDIIYYNEKSERKKISGNTTAQSYFSELNNLYLQEVCHVLTSCQDSLNTIYRNEAFNILRDHILQSFKTCMVALLKRSAPLVIPGPESLKLLHCGNSHQRRKFKYEDNLGELIDFGFGAVCIPENKELITIEWVEFAIEKERFIRILERPVAERCAFVANVIQHPI